MRGDDQLGVGFADLNKRDRLSAIYLVAESDADYALELMRAHPSGDGSRAVGRVTDDAPSMVTLKSRIGATRIVDMFSGEQLPRIC